MRKRADKAVQAAIEDFQRLEQELGDVLFKHSRRVDAMALVAEVQAAFDAYRAAVNAKIADLASQDLTPLADDIAAAQAELNPTVAEPAP